MIKPHGSDQLNALYVSDDAQRKALADEAEGLPSLLLNSAAAANAVMLGAGYFNPLTGYMNLADAMSVAENLHTVDGLLWPVPIVNLSNDSSVQAGGRIALRDPNVEGNPVLAIMDVDSVESVSDEQIDFMAEKIFRTLDPEHPGVATFRSLGRTLLAGPIQVLSLSYFQSDFPETFRTAVEIREQIASLGWDKVVAFQTRNPMHRAHEELCRMALEDLSADGILIHMLLGKLKPGDSPADVRDDAIRTMVNLYFPENSAIVTVTVSICSTPARARPCCTPTSVRIWGPVISSSGAIMPGSVITTAPSTRNPFLIPRCPPMPLISRSSVPTTPPGRKSWIGW